MAMAERLVDRARWPARAFGVFLIMHGTAHWVGTSQSFGKAADHEAVDYLGGLWSVSGGALRALGVLWAMVGAAYLVAGWAYLVSLPRRRTILVAITVPSLVLSIAASPTAIVGAIIDVVLLTAAWRASVRELAEAALRPPPIAA